MSPYIFLLLLPLIHANTLLGPALFPRFTQVRTADNEAPTPRFRLPSNVVPRRYVLKIRPILDGEDRFTAPGEVRITLECLVETRFIVLHAAELDINESSVSVTQTDGATLGIVRQTNDTSNAIQSYTIEVDRDLEVGKTYEVYIKYTAIVAAPSHRMNGLYYSTYQHDNEIKYLATTQFSRTLGFRKTLPSFDDPSFKAIFEISIGRKSSYHSLSNMDINRTEEDIENPGWEWDHYNPTPVMSPTIIAFIVSEFGSEMADENLFDKPVKIWAPPPELTENGAVYAAEIAAKTLKYFQDYFGIEYELPKIDCAAIPDFAAGAMENWGLNTYRVIYLIWKNGRNTVAEKFRIANIIGHELAHQYWGNLVTHAWWNDWWLTEGFASYFEYRSVDAIDPDYEAIDRLLTLDIQPAMEFDVGPESVPIHGVDNNSFIENPSAINYNKGAALVNLMRSFMSEEVFKGAVSFYLRERSHTAVHQDALFTDLNTYLTQNNRLPTNNRSINDIMLSWTTTTGYPLIRVSRVSQGLVFVSQERFTSRTNLNTTSSLFHVPIFYITQTNPTFDRDNNLPKFWLDKEVLLTSHSVDTNQWLLVNPGGEGYYRVLYDEHFERLLREQMSLDLGVIPIGSRSMIVDDYFTAAYAGYIGVKKAIEMTEFMFNETNFNVWVPYMKHLLKAVNLYSGNESEYSVLKNHFFKATRTAMQKIDYTQKPNEKPVDTILRVQLLDWLCPMGDSECVNQGNTLVGEWRTSGVNGIPIDIRPALYCASTLNDTNGVNWEFLMNEYETNNDATARNALACTSNATQIQILLDAIVLGKFSEALIMMQRLSMNGIARWDVIDTVVLYFTTLIEGGKLGSSGMTSLISTLSGYIKDPFALERLRTVVDRFQDQLGVEYGKILSVFEAIDRNMIWVEQFGDEIVQLLRQ